MLISNNCIKHSEVDNYNDGCDPDTTRSELLDIQIKGESLNDIKQAIKDHFDCTEECILINPCEFDDEKNRIDVQFLERKSGIIADKTNIEEWKKGNTRLWLVTYSFYFELLSDNIDLMEYVNNEQ